LQGPLADQPQQCWSLVESLKRIAVYHRQPDAQLKDLQDTNKELLQKYKNLKDDRFKQAEQFFLDERNGIVDRDEAAENIRQKLDEKLCDNISQVRLMFDRITASHTLEAPYRDVFVTTIKQCFHHRIFDKKNKCIVDVDNLLSLVGQNPFTNKPMDLFANFFKQQN
jgi:hypothetical protein